LPVGGQFAVAAEKRIAIRAGFGRVLAASDCAAGA